MKRVIPLLFVLCLIIWGCGKDTNPTGPGDHTAYLKIYNATAAVISITFSDEVKTIQPAETCTKIYDFGKSINVVYHASGDYITDGDYSSTLTAGSITNVTFNPEAGCVKYYNYTNEQITLTSGSYEYPVPADTYFKLKFYLPDASSATGLCSAAGTYLFSENHNRTVYRNATVTEAIYANAGAIQVSNYSSVNITSVYLSPSTDTSWGTDDLAGYIYPGYFTKWTASAGLWDIKIVADNGFYYTFTSRSVINNATTTISFSTKKSLEPEPSKCDGGIDGGRTCRVSENLKLQ